MSFAALIDALLKVQERRDLREFVQTDTEAAAAIKENWRRRRRGEDGPDLMAFVRRRFEEFRGRKYSNGGMNHGKG